MPDQADPLDGDVDLLRRRLPRQDDPEWVDIRTGDVELQCGDRVRRDPDDAVDVRAGVGDPAGDGVDRTRPQRPAQHGDDRPAVPATRVVALARLDLALHGEIRGGRLHRPNQGLRVAGDDTSTPRISRPRSTIWSRSSTATGKRLSASNTAAVTPGRSRPDIVMRSVGVVTTVNRSRPPAG